MRRLRSCADAGLLTRNLTEIESHGQGSNVRLYQELSSELSWLESWRLEEVKKHLAELCEKYPSYDDFDNEKYNKILNKCFK